MVIVMFRMFQRKPGLISEMKMPLVEMPLIAEENNGENKHNGEDELMHILLLTEPASQIMRDESDEQPAHQIMRDAPLRPQIVPDANCCEKCLMFSDGACTGENAALLCFLTCSLGCLSGCAGGITAGLIGCVLGGVKYCLPDMIVGCGLGCTLGSTIGLFGTIGKCCKDGLRRTGEEVERQRGEHVMQELEQGFLPQEMNELIVNYSLPGV